MSCRTTRMSRTARAIAARVSRTGSRMVSRPAAAVARSALARPASTSPPAASDSCLLAGQQPVGLGQGGLLGGVQLGRVQLSPPPLEVAPRLLVGDRVGRAPGE